MSSLNSTSTSSLDSISYIPSHPNIFHVSNIYTNIDYPKKNIIADPELDMNPGKQIMINCL